LQEALNRKAGVVQHEFNAIGEKLQALSRKITEARGEDPAPLIAEQEGLREQQRVLADEVNLWRDRARGALRQQGDEALRAYLNELLAANEEEIRPAVEYALYLLDAPEEELAKLAQSQAQARPTTPVGRLIERAHTEYDLRGQDPAPRHKAAVEFANRAGMAQNDEALDELEAALADKDPLVKEVVTLTLIQMHRFRAMRLGDLDAVYASVQRLSHLNHPAAIPVLIEIVETPRTGFARGEGGMVEENNNRSREAALISLIQWHTPEAQAAIRARQRDRDTHIAQGAARALELYPGEWK
jgi:HEAT repeat protein